MVKDFEAKQSKEASIAQQQDETFQNLSNIDANGSTAITQEKALSEISNSSKKIKKGKGSSKKTSPAKVDEDDDEF